MSIWSVRFLSEQHAENIEPRLDQAMIPITNPEHVACLSPGWGRLLRLQFVDGEYWEDALKSAGNARFGLYASCIQENQAREILDFIEACAGDTVDYELLVHCWAGQRRSGAVAKYVSERFGVAITPAPQRVNATVYELLKNPSAYKNYFEVLKVVPRQTLWQRAVEFLRVSKVAFF